MHGLQLTVIKETTELPRGLCEIDHRTLDVTLVEGDSG
jgi:hypothetical protein